MTVDLVLLPIPLPTIIDVEMIEAVNSRRKLRDVLQGTATMLRFHPDLVLTPRATMACPHGHLVRLDLMMIATVQATEIDERQLSHPVI